MPVSAMLGVLVVAASLVTCTATAPGTSRLGATDAFGTGTLPGVRVELAQLPLMFIENRGQTSSGIDYYAEGSRASVGFGADGVRWTLGDTETMLRTAFIGGRAVRPIARSEAPGVVSYFRGEPSDWTTGLRTYERVFYRNLWPGIDVVYTGDQRSVKYAFRVAPGADPSAIRVAYRGANRIRLNDRGQLEIAVDDEQLIDDAPIAWQPGAGSRDPVRSSFRVHRKTYGFDLGGYDPTRPLVIDPVVFIYAGYVGGAGRDFGYAIDVDKHGAAYVAGTTWSDPQTYNSADAFVAKVAPDGSGLVYTVYIGGSQGEDGLGVAVDDSGAAYVTGYTESDVTFPVSGGPSTTCNEADAFVAKVNPAGTALDYAGCIGGTAVDVGEDIAVDSSGAAYVTGAASIPEWPNFPDSNPPSSDFGGAFVAKVAASGSSLVYAGYVTQTWSGYGIDVDSSGAAYVAGATGHPLFSGGDAFVAKVLPDGSALAYRKAIGGSAKDEAGDVAVDSTGAAYVTGFTFSDESTFPVTGGPDPIFNTHTDYGGSDAFVAKVSPSGSTLDYAGYIGGEVRDAGRGISVDASGAAYVTGLTNSENFPATDGPDLDYAGDYADFKLDAFVAKVAPGGGSLAYAGYIGGTDHEEGWGIATDSLGSAYVAGQTSSSDLLTVVGPDTSWNGAEDAFVAKVAEPGTMPPSPPSSPSPSPSTSPSPSPSPSESPSPSPAPEVPLDPPPEPSEIPGCDPTQGHICGTQGDDVITITAEDVPPGGVLEVFTGDGNDVICIEPNLAATIIIHAGSGSDTVTVGCETSPPRSSPSRPAISLSSAGPGGGASATVIIAFGDDGHDRLKGGTASDRLVGGHEGDVLLGGDGDDLLQGQAGNDSLRGGGGRDRLSGGGGGDQTFGGTGRDRCKPSRGVDTERSC